MSIAHLITKFVGDSELKFSTTYSFIDGSKLPNPTIIVQELAVIKSVVIRRVCFSMVGWCQHCHLVSVYTVEAEKQLHLFRNLEKKILRYFFLNLSLTDSMIKILNEFIKRTDTLEK